jgi:hypothetical protein
MEQEQWRASHSARCFNTPQYVIYSTSSHSLCVCSGIYYLTQYCVLCWSGDLAKICIVERGILAHCWWRIQPSRVLRQYSWLSWAPSIARSRERSRRPFTLVESVSSFGITVFCWFIGVSFFRKVFGRKFVSDYRPQHANKMSVAMTLARRRI